MYSKLVIANNVEEIKDWSSKRKDMGRLYML